MRKISHIVIMVALLMLAPFAFAAQGEEATESKLSGLSLSATFSYVHYSEPGVMNEFGNLPGLRATYYKQVDFSPLNYLFEGDYQFGYLTYDGGDFSGNRFQSRTKDSIINLRGTLGRLNEIAPNLTLNPFIGLGFRSLTDKAEGSGGYTRKISYLYIPLGVETATWFLDKWSIVFNADFDWMVSGVVVSYLSEVSAGNPDLTMHNNGWGARLLVSLRRDFGPYSVHVEPFYQNWTIAQSDVITVYDSSKGKYVGLIEPQNSSNMLGLNVGVDF